ncbi:unnamed protein product [Thelazia callipaeda]|uniref:Lactamase_B domain-containing protein n=1 Tax=Thelazia callipaeda TaxID=103827 RepID=A0A0N5CJH4_THECL|nr:unnamed protein product [Thelazia callipaeda]
MDEYPRVFVLLEGYCRRADAECSDGYEEASGTVTLIVTRERKILVDCGDPWNGACIVEEANDFFLALSKYSLSCNDITDLIITHGHSDHCGNMSLFQQATIYMADDNARDGWYYTYTVLFRLLNFFDPRMLDNCVEIRLTPGHTDHDRSVIVTNTEFGTIAVVGDIFEEKDDVKTWRKNSKYPQDQERSREAILQVADWIIPGHGQMFKNLRK